MNNIANKVLLCGLKTSCIGTSLVDEEVTEEILQNHNAVKGSMKATKTRLKSAIEPFKALRRRAGKYITGQTLPGISDDLRIIPSSRIPAVRAKIIEFQDEDAQLLTKLVADYPAEVEKDRAALGGHISEGGRFDPSLYPAVESLSQHFNLQLIVCDLPSGDYSRIADLDEAAKAQMKAEHDAMLTQVGVAARSEVMKKLTGLIQAVADKMAQRTLKGCTESTFAKLREYLDEVQELNITGDPTVEAMRQAAAEQLNYSMKIVKDSDVLKEQAAEAAKSILNRFGAVGVRKMVA